MNDSFGLHLYESFRRTYGHIVAFMSLMIGFALYIFAEHPAKLAISATAVIVLVVSVIVASFFDAAVRAWSQSTLQPPLIVDSGPAPVPYPSSDILIVAKQNPFFYRDAEVSVFCKKNDVEYLVGIGRVVDAQYDQSMQVLVTRIVAEGNEFYDALCNPGKDGLKSILIKPGVPRAARELGT